MSACSFSPEMFFYSAPTSPSRLKLRAPFDSQTDPATPRESEYDDANYIADEFEFETSRRFNASVSDLEGEANQKDDNDNPSDDSSQTMSFADELFCDGKVLPLMPPLKPPPRLHKVGVSGIHRSKLASSRSPGPAFRLRLARYSLRNDDFDPFMVALEKVTGEKRRKPNARHVFRRSKSLSPFRGFSHKFNRSVRLTKSSQLESRSDKAQLLCELGKRPLKEVSGRIKMLPESKGLVFARRVRLELATETKKDEGKRGGFWTRNKKRDYIKKFLFGARNMGKTNAYNKLEDKMEAQEKPPSVWKLSMKAVTSTEPKQMRLACHRPRPRFFLCLGYEHEE